MKIKILNNVCHAGAIHNAGAVVDLKAVDAALLVKAGHAEEHVQEDTPLDRNRQGLFNQYAKASRQELEKVKAVAEAVLAREPGRADAQQVIEVITELLKKK